jgi:hypothetical protein
VLRIPGGEIAFEWDCSVATEFEQIVESSKPVPAARANRLRSTGALLVKRYFST